MAMAWPDVQSRRRGHVHTDEILKFAKLFDDELTLDNLQHPTLRALCRMLNLPAYASSSPSLSSPSYLNKSFTLSLSRPSDYGDF